ncbi:GMP/IMP nucleotidase [bacterium]|nr:GMP/IMP nucleotidase [bacterium]
MILDWASRFNWDQVDTVLLDMDGTLLDLHFDSFFWLQHLPKRYGEKYGLPIEQAIPDIKQRLADKQGTLDWYCTEFWSRELDMDIVGLKREIQHLIGERPQTIDFLQALGDRGKDRVLITNAHRDSLDIKFSVTDIQPLLDKVISSHDYGCPKEDQNFWQQLQQNMPFDPARTLFIDDSEPVLRSAEVYGIGHLLAIETPDSQQASRPYFGFPAIQQFAQILNLRNPKDSHGKI